LLIVATAISAFSFGQATRQPPDTQADRSSAANQDASTRHGADLFLAKGCVVCHTHSAFTAERRAFEGLQVGPDLSHVQRDANYLRVWLKDPASVKPDTKMPTLDLKGQEIEALIAFLHSSAAQSPADQRLTSTK
jgi:cytochrome c1